MKSRTLMFATAMTLFLILALVPTALASTTWYADGVNGNDNNDCKSAQHACKTIGHAISLCSSGDSIMVAAATYNENLTISISLNVLGADASTTFVDSGGPNVSVVTISNSSANVKLSQLAIRGGLALYGGGIYNLGTVTINNSTIRGNEAWCHCMAAGGGIYNSKGATLTINNSTISGNLTHYGSGGGIFNLGAVTLNNSTISGNTATLGTGSGPGGGGGISNRGALTINNSTISGNTASHSPGYWWGAVGGGIEGRATLQNTIVANNGADFGGNCDGTQTSKGYNLSSDNSCTFNGPGDMNNIDPRLGTLGNKGGPTQTIPLLAGSPAIDAGNPSGCTDGKGHLLKTDQRGYPRPDPEDTGGCDMGAYERQSD